MAQVKRPQPKAKKGTMAERAKQRPANHEEMSPQEQWETDKELGILDWDGKP